MRVDDRCVDYVRHGGGSVNPVAEQTGTILMALMATDAWFDAKEVVVGWWWTIDPDRASQVDADLEQLAHEIGTDGYRVSKTTIRQWEDRFQQLLSEDPNQIERLRRLLIEELVPRMTGVIRPGIGPDRTRPHHPVAGLAADLAGRERVLGNDHPATQALRWPLAVACDLHGYLAPAIELYQQIAADREQALGRDHPDTVITRGMLACAQQRLAGTDGPAGNLEWLIPLLEQTLAEHERVLGIDAHETGVVRGSLADTYFSAGASGQAFALYERVVAERERAHGLDSLATVHARWDLAVAYESSGDLARAITIFEQVLADHARLLGDGHSKTDLVRRRLAAAYLPAGDLVKAIAMLERILLVRDRVDDVDLPGDRSRLADAYLSAGNPERAIPLYELALTGCVEVFPSDHPAVLDARTDLANAYTLAGSPDLAIPLYEHNLALLAEDYYPGHPTTLDNRSRLAAAQELMRNRNRDR